MESKAAKGFLKRSTLQDRLREAGYSAAQMKLYQQSGIAARRFVSLRRRKTNSKIPGSVGKLIKLLNLPVVEQKMNGSYLSIPFWDEQHKRKVPIRVVLEKILDPCDSKKLSAYEINSILDRHFQYDEYKWQYESKIRVTYPKRAEGLLRYYTCAPNAKTNFR